MTFYSGGSRGGGQSHLFTRGAMSVYSDWGGGGFLFWF